MSTHSTPIPNAENPWFRGSTSNFDFRHYTLSHSTPLIISSWMSTHSIISPISENPGFRSSNSELRISTLSFIPLDSPDHPLLNDYPLVHILNPRKYRISKFELRTSTFDLTHIPQSSPHCPLLNEYSFDHIPNPRKYRISKFELWTSNFDIIPYAIQLPSLPALERLPTHPHFPIPKIPDFEVRTPNFDFRLYHLSHSTPLIIRFRMTTHSTIFQNP